MAHSNENFKSLSRSEKKEEIKRIKKERKTLRKDLRARGIKKRSDFEYYARALGLSLPEETAEGFLALFMFRATAAAKIIAASTGIYGVLAAGTAFLGSLLFYTYVTEEKGHFTINMTYDMMQEGFTMSQYEDFHDEKLRLYTDPITNVNAISIDTINRGIADVDGSHNGAGYLAYTFYIKNGGEMTTNYAYTMNITSKTMGAEKASWVMLFEDGKQTIYADMSANGDPEELYGYYNMPFGDQAYDQETQYYVEDGKIGIVTTPFIDENTVLQGLVKDFEPGEVKKYTAVIWLEGDDPDCTNEILGGHVGFNIQFDRLGEDIEGFFKGLYRQEYHVTQQGVIVEDDEDARTVLDDNPVFESEAAGEKITSN